MALPSGSRGNGFPILEGPPPIPPRRELDRAASLQFRTGNEAPPIPPRHASLHETQSVRVPLRGTNSDAHTHLPNKSLISLSPVENYASPLENYTPSSNATSGFLADLDGLDFSDPGRQTFGKERRSSSLEDLPSSTSRSAYPDISGAFNEIRPNVYGQQTTMYPQIPNPNPTSSYGWNQNLFNKGYEQNNTNSVPSYQAPAPPIGFVLDVVPPVPGVGCPGNPFAPPSGQGAWGGSTRVNSLPRPASCGDVFDSAWKEVGVNDGGWAQFEQEQFLQPSPAQSGSSSGDLMNFHGEPVVEYEYLSLDYFDPLYHRARKESVSVVPNETAFTFSFGDAFPSLTKAQAEPQTPDTEKCINQLNEWASADQPQIHVQDLDVPVPVGESVMYRSEGTSLSRESSTAKPPPRPPSWKTNTKASMPEKLRTRLFIDEESNAFCQMVAELKSHYKSTDEKTNPGLIISPVSDKKHKPTSVKVIIHFKPSQEPVSFTCDTHTLVEHVISQVVYSESPSHGQQLTSSDFVLKVYDRAEYLQSHLSLSSLDYVHHCMKLDEDIRFQMLHKQDVLHPFLRTVDDDSQMLYFPKEYIKTDKEAVSRDSLEILLDTFYQEMERMSDLVLKGEIELVQPKQIHQSVKAICTNLAKIETTDISKALERLERILSDLKNPSNRASSLMAGSGTQADRDTMDAINVAIRCSYVEELQEAMDQMVISVKQLVRMYCHTFHTDFTLGPPLDPQKDMQDITLIRDTFIVHVATSHRMPQAWLNHYEGYKVVCSLYHGTKKLAEDVSTNMKPAVTLGLCERIVWDEWIDFKNVSLCILPRESRLCLTLCGLKSPQSGGSADTTHKVTIVLGGATIQLYSQDGHLNQGSQLVPLMMGVKADPIMPSCKTLLPDSVLLQVNLPDFEKNLFFPETIKKPTSPRKSYNMLIPDIKKSIEDVLDKDSSSTYAAEEMEILWTYRTYLHERPELLPRILQAAHSWDWACLADTYALLQSWPPVQAMQSFELLLPQFPDLRVREFSVDSLSRIPTDNLIDFLPQLIQALKFESYHNSSLARLLLEQSCKSIRFAHQFFWLLKGAAALDPMFKRRYELMFVALASVAGDALYREFKKQEDLVRTLSATAEKVQTAKDKDTTLKRELQAVYDLFEDKGRLLLPYNPSLEVCGIDIKSCSYFTSNAFPLKLVFKNSNTKSDPIYVMFKVGDDLRQDMLTLQMIQIMDRLWLKDGLDLRMITFSCLATGPKKGIVELVTEAETLRKIQVSYGVTGSFKERPIKEWLQKHNPTELEYQKAVDNFTCSCAGYCVATYVLGIGDRHNDNIMLKQSGHMFHIDFSKFLGDSQMFGSFKRDRVPFVLTSDMAFVINDGGRRRDRFQRFVDLCCKAFNILRKHADLFHSLFVMMARSGIPGVSERAAAYVRQTLLPGQSDAQAAALFTRMIEESLKSVFTQFNFFIHNLAQLKFSSHQEGALLSFVPKTYSMQTDGKILRVELVSFDKRYTPEKHYIYKLLVERQDERVHTHIYRLFQEFVEFRDKLASIFSLVTWPNFSTRMVLGRSNIRTVAESRGVEIRQFLEALWQKAPEISECDLVYTFFHTLLRDEQENSSANNISPGIRGPVMQTTSNATGVCGEVQLSLQYKKDSLQVLIMHAKDLSPGPDFPSPYVKTYLLPDPEKQTKQKTKVMKNSAHPTYNEVIEYKMPLEKIQQRVLQVSVWDQALGQNNLMGSVYLKLRDLDLSKEICRWHQLGSIQLTDSLMA
ncbi:phosphatidylinositol 4-phosphate 3-kinase C2 domain-containing subunit alpha-like [Haliotis asinina]|uniref:phosphatidylinositol 4-phosphate 3-kinase C2 domain-containing subunit alpha-like n=1 Tax=Haliotis asinina TaxID=109174 RepID=UPI0035322F72